MRLSIAIVIFLHSYVGICHEFFYADKPRSLEINANDASLLLFPSPSLTHLCQPSGVVDLSTLKSLYQAQTILPNRQRYAVFDQINQETKNNGVEDKNRDFGLARMLKITPLKRSGSTICAIGLVSGETVQVRFDLSSQLERPFVEFKHISDFKREGVINKIGGLNIFRDLLKGGDLSYFINITPSFTRWRTENANWKIEYVGTDYKTYKAWRIKGIARRNFEGPEFIETSFVGQIIFSAWKKSRFLKKDDEYFLYLLTTHDFGKKEMMRRLP